MAHSGEIQPISSVFRGAEKWAGILLRGEWAGGLLRPTVSRLDKELGPDFLSGYELKRQNGFNCGEISRHI
jgi:hypothetical protein